MSSLHLDFVQLQDVPEVARLDRHAFYPNEHPYIEAMNPDSYTEGGLRSKIQQWNERLNHLLPNEHWLKVTDTDTGHIILTGTWLTPCKDEENLQQLVSEPKIQGPYWKNEDELAWAQHLTVRYTQRRRDAFAQAKGRMFAVTHLAVDPPNQGKGAGSLFMAWGIEQADRLGFDCVVESSLRAEGYYMKWGFEARERVRLQPPEDEASWKEKGVQEYVWMVRPPQKTRSRS